jgi:uncharacterized protein (UPF0333 family)
LNSTYAIAIGAVVVLAGVAIYTIQKSKTSEAQAAVNAYAAGQAAGSKRTDAERLGGAIGGILGVFA